MERFEIGKLYAIHIGGLSASLYPVIARTDHTVTFGYVDGPKKFKIKNDAQGEHVFGHKCLHAYAYGNQQKHEYMD